MKLINKRTAEINEAEAREDGIYIKANWSKEEKWFLYDLKTLANGWDYYVEPAEFKRYRLIKDLPTFKAGEIFVLENTIEQQGLFRESDDIMAYHQKTIEKFPNILTDWFEEIKPAEPLIKNEKVRKAVRAWADAVGTTHAYLHIEHEEPSTFYVYNLGVNCHYIQIAIHDKNPIEDERIYTITELCGEQE